MSGNKDTQLDREPSKDVSLEINPGESLFEFPKVLEGERGHQVVQKFLSTNRGSFLLRGAVILGKRRRHHAMLRLRVKPR
jgi:hypothetical protein